MNDIPLAMGKRHRARIGALKILYAIDIKDELHQISTEGLDEISTDNNEEIDSFTQSITLGVSENLEEIDILISETSTSWKVQRMSVVDRNILRIGIWELMAKENAPIVINEAILLASQFGSENSTSFINGILDTINKKFSDSNILKDE